MVDIAGQILPAMFKNALLQFKIKFQPACPFKGSEDDSPFLHDLKLAILKAKSVPPSITPNLIADVLPVTMKERNPTRERKAPVKCNQQI